MKYIIIERDLPNNMVEVLPFIFPANCVHSLVATVMQSMLRRTHPECKTRVVSAGFYNPGIGACYGVSESLKMSSRPQDVKIISTIDYFPVREV